MTTSMKTKAVVELELKVVVAISEEEAARKPESTIVDDPAHWVADTVGDQALEALAAHFPTLSFLAPVGDAVKTRLIARED